MYSKRSIKSRMSVYHNTILGKGQNQRQKISENAQVKQIGMDSFPQPPPTQEAGAQAPAPGGGRAIARLEARVGALEHAMRGGRGRGMPMRGRGMPMRGRGIPMRGSGSGTSSAFTNAPTTLKGTEHTGSPASFLSTGGHSITSSPARSSGMEADESSGLNVLTSGETTSPVREIQSRSTPPTMAALRHKSDLMRHRAGLGTAISKPLPDDPPELPQLPPSPIPPRRKRRSHPRKIDVGLLEPSQTQQFSDDVDRMLSENTKKIAELQRLKKKYSGKLSQKNQRQ